MTDIEIINEKIKEHGLNLFDAPLYRVVWSDYQTEMRRGIFKVTFGSLFLGEELVTKRVPKYNYIIERWILERWFPPSLSFNPELPDSSQGDYIPLYIFQDKFGNPLPVVEKVVQRIIHCAEHPTHETTEEKVNKLLEEEDKEVEAYMNALEVSPITNALHMREAVGYDSRIKKEYKQ